MGRASSLHCPIVSALSPRPGKKIVCAPSFILTGNPTALRHGLVVVEEKQASSCNIQWMFHIPASTLLQATPVTMAHAQAAN